jgi:hypothetical protein
MAATVTILVAASVAFVVDAIMVLPVTGLVAAAAWLLLPGCCCLAAAVEAEVAAAVASTMT